MKQCTKEVNQDAIHATIKAAQAQYEGKTAWINSFSVPEDLPQYAEKSHNPGYIDQEELGVAQQGDPAISPVNAMETEWKKIK